jgi:hypothetical protein
LYFSPHSPRQQRHLAFISVFNVQLLYLPALKNVIADFLSHPLPQSAGSVATAAADPVDYEEMATETQRLLGGTSLKLAFRQTGPNAWLVMFPQAISAQFLSPSSSEKIFFCIFIMLLASRGIISSRIVWRGLSSDITAWTRECLACQWGKIHRQTRLAPQPIPIPQ